MFTVTSLKLNFGMQKLVKAFACFDCEYGNETIMLLNEHGCHLKRNFEYTVIT